MFDGGGGRSQRVAGGGHTGPLLESDPHLHPLGPHPANDLSLEIFLLTDYRVDDRLVC